METVEPMLGTSKGKPNNLNSWREAEWERRTLTAQSEERGEGIPPPFLLCVILKSV
jgi:hypothetical protein